MPPRSAVTAKNIKQVLARVQKGKGFSRFGEVWQVFKGLNRELPDDSSIPSLGRYPKELKTGLQTNVHRGIIDNNQRGRPPKFYQQMNRYIK